MKWSWSEVAQSCSTLCNPMDGSLPGSAVHGIFQARILEWAAISFSRGSSQPRDRTRVSCIADRPLPSEPLGKPDKAKWPSKITTQNTELKHMHINLAVLIRHSLKYKNTVSQKTSCRDTELQQREERKSGWKKKGEEAGEGVKGVALQTSSATYRYPGVMGLFPGPPEKGGLELGPTRNQTRPEPEFEFSAKRRWSVSNPQLRMRAVRPDSCVQDRGTRKTGKDRKG